MVLVPVGEHATFDAVGVLPQVGEVGQDEVDAGHLHVGEHEPAVEQHDAAVDFDAGAVAPDLTQPPEEDDPYGISQCRRRDPATPHGLVVRARRARARAGGGTGRPGAPAPAGPPWWESDWAPDRRSRTPTTAPAGR